MRNYIAGTAQSYRDMADGRRGRSGSLAPRGRYDRWNSFFGMSGLTSMLTAAWHGTPTDGISISLFNNGRLTSFASTSKYIVDGNGRGDGSINSDIGFFSYGTGVGGNLGTGPGFDDWIARAGEMNMKYALAYEDTGITDPKKQDKQCPNCELADMIRGTLFLNSGAGVTLNPFFGAEAIFVDSGVNFFGNEADAGIFFILTGDDKGKVIGFSEYALGGGTEFGGAGEFGRIDYTRNPSDFDAIWLDGYRDKGWIGGSIGAAGGGIGISVSEVFGKGYLIGTHFQVGYGASTPIISGGFNSGKVDISKGE